MTETRPIVLIEDNLEDRKMFTAIFCELKLFNKMLCFNSCSEAQYYLSSEKINPFLVFS